MWAPALTRAGLDNFVLLRVHLVCECAFRRRPIQALVSVQPLGLVLSARPPSLFHPQVLSHLFPSLPAWAFFSHSGYESSLFSIIKTKHIVYDLSSPIKGCRILNFKSRDEMLFFHFLQSQFFSKGMGTKDLAHMGVGRDQTGEQAYSEA